MSVIYLISSQFKFSEWELGKMTVSLIYEDLLVPEIEAPEFFGLSYQQMLMFPSYFALGDKRQGGNLELEPL